MPRATDHHSISIKWIRLSTIVGILALFALAVLAIEAAGL
jgi:hypothetical protein